MKSTSYEILQQRLNEVEASHTRLLNHLPGMAYRCVVERSYEYRMVFASKGSERLLGLTVDEVMKNPSNTVERMTHEEDLAKMRKRIHEAISQRKSYEIYYRVRLPSDETRWIWDQGEGVFDAAGNCTYLEGIMMDVTAQKAREFKLKEENTLLRTSAANPAGFSRIIGTSEPMQRVYNLLLKAAKTNMSVILYGETGVGKDLAAQTIHEMSNVKGRYIPVNCAAIPEQLLESEFFGHVKGAFSGATTNRPGYLAAADDGTLFLDEIADLPLNLQVKLLRALEGKSYTPVGSNDVKTSNFRLISATNRNLSELVKNKSMRADFFYRIHVLPIVLPPLRERRADIPLLVADYARKKGISKPVPKQIMQQLVRHGWPGNVRELQNTLENYWAFGELVLASETPCPDIFDFAPLKAQEDEHSASTVSFSSESMQPNSASTAGPVFQHSPTDGSLSDAKSQIEMQRILLALEQNSWKKGKTADTLGVTIRTLQRKLKKYGIKRHS
ncbi:sigma 54-interacting transcriptional regulator [Desulfovibrio subterraneus]|uniref:sigma-54 interaction domain-containing protein n=1 Tax=Desulfovibrio subterraneus TaxID=2718620 RepID=UPI0022B86257|nr:sigma 54-interacting transcriptional regulator [Desulfovibrio subterraneus]WBF66229.1 sigma 54-interacting transcriptional regulator [Desulfovibrio subterraneus]